jgi:anti-sigma-K factor RskA
MATPDEQWWDAQAGKYALGTLRGTERDVFEKILEVDS